MTITSENKKMEFVEPKMECQYNSEDLVFQDSGSTSCNYIEQTEESGKTWKFVLICEQSNVIL